MCVFWGFVFLCYGVYFVQLSVVFSDNERLVARLQASIVPTQTFSQMGNHSIKNKSAWGQAARSDCNS